MKKIYLLFCAAALATSIFAFDYCRPGYLQNLTTPSIKKDLLEANQSANNKNYVKAIKLIDKALANKSAPEFSAKPNQDGPLDLQLKAAKAYYRFLMGCDKTKGPGCLDEEMKNISLATLKEYNKSAKGKKWNAYESFYHRLIQYYHDKKNTKKAEEYLDKIVEYHPEAGTVAYLYWGLKLKLPTEKVEQKVNNYLKTGGQYSSYIMLMRIRYKDRDGGNVFEECTAFLSDHPVARINDLNIILELLRKSLDITDKEQVKEYYNTINRLAFAQPNTEERLTLVSRILDERRKVEMIFSNVKNNE